MYYYDRDVEEIDVYTRPVVSGFITDGNGTPREAIIPGQTAYTGFYVEDVSGSANTLSISHPAGVGYDLTIQKSTDGKTWSTMGTTSSTAITATVPANGRLYLRCNANAWTSSSVNGNQISCSGNFNVGGNILSLFYGTSFTGEETSLPSNSGYEMAFMFNGVNTLISAQDLIIPVTALNTWSCNKMFSYSRNLTYPPDMSSITTLSQGSCYCMFQGCSKLTVTPVLNAAVIPQYAYKQMFDDCSLLSTVYCYATDISANQCIYQWMNGVAASGTFNRSSNCYKWIAGINGIPNGWNVTPTFYITLENTSSSQVYLRVRFTFETVDKTVTSANNYSYYNTSGYSDNRISFEYSMNNGQTWTTTSSRYGIQGGLTNTNSTTITFRASSSIFNVLTVPANGVVLIRNFNVSPGCSGQVIAYNTKSTSQTINQNLTTYRCLMGDSGSNINAYGTYSASLNSLSDSTAVSKCLSSMKGKYVIS